MEWTVFFIASFLLWVSFHKLATTIWLSEVSLHFMLQVTCIYRNTIPSVMVLTFSLDLRPAGTIFLMVDLT